jgi:hypothetical protein
VKTGEDAEKSITLKNIVELEEGMTMTVGQPVLAISGACGFQSEVICRVASAGAEINYTYPYEFLVGMNG